ncbi:hypothetical protein R3W88_000673 [Solanum pinnatisectum]|uniref:F-box domain-containing protein n=1 Tax=Solanum pinnatisectum TaxID=50273 RepID=A0AAV9MFZ5_9SOLN|nr:hypothetical protein R3W88_000673 [Solanum pinnatisectum]
MEAYDILFPIIIKLSVKSLLHFQSVSKLWNAIISDKEFRDQSKALSTTKFLLVQTNDGVFEFRDLENPQIIMRKQKFPLKRFQNPIVMGSCDSLNSYTNEYRIFVCPYLKGMSPHGCGLMYDSGDDMNAMNKWIKKTNSSSKRIEKVVIGVTLYPKSLECIMGISVIGDAFWSFSSLEILHQFVNTYSMIIYFDVKTGELKNFAKPYFVSAYQLFRLTSLKGCVGLYGGCVGLYGGFTGFNIVLLDCTRNSEILFQIGRSLERLVMYDPKRHEFIQTICISEDSKHDSIFEDSKHDIIPICSESFYFPIET